MDDLMEEFSSKDEIRKQPRYEVEDELGEVPYDLRPRTTTRP